MGVHLQQVWEALYDAKEAMLWMEGQLVPIDYVNETILYFFTTNTPSLFPVFERGASLYPSYKFKKESKQSFSGASDEIRRLLISIEPVANQIFTPRMRKLYASLLYNKALIRCADKEFVSSEEIFSFGQMQEFRSSVAAALQRINSLMDAITQYKQHLTPKLT